MLLEFTKADDGTLTFRLPNGFTAVAMPELLTLFHAGRVEASNDVNDLLAFMRREGIAGGNCDEAAVFMIAVWCMYALVEAANFEDTADFGEVLQ